MAKQESLLTRTAAKKNSLEAKRRVTYLHCNNQGFLEVTSERPDEYLLIKRTMLMSFMKFFGCIYLQLD